MTTILEEQGERAACSQTGEYLFFHVDFTSNGDWKVWL